MILRDWHKKIAMVEKKNNGRFRYSFEGLLNSERGAEKRTEIQDTEQKV